MSDDDAGTAPSGGLVVVLADGVDGSARLLVSGELDLATADVLFVAVDTAATGGATDVELDLTAVPFIDSSGIGVIVRSHRRMVANGGRLTIGPRSPVVARVLELSGVEATFDEPNS